MAQNIKPVEEKKITGGNPNDANPDSKCPRIMKNEFNEPIGPCNGLFVWDGPRFERRRCVRCEHTVEYDKVTGKPLKK